MKVSKLRTAAVAIFLVVPSVLLPLHAAAQEVNVGFTTTPSAVVEGMLDLAGTDSSDYVIDLGSGDGRIVIAAALRGAIAHGVELDSELVSLSYQRAADAGVGNRVLFLEEDFFDTDFSMASVLTLYVLESTNRMLKPILLQNLKPGSRVVSHRYKMGEWEPDAEKEVDFRKIYKWIIPADFSGTWAWKTDEMDVEATFDQSYQKITEKRISNSSHSNLHLIKAYIHGSNIKITIQDREADILWVCRGLIDGDKIEGVMHVYNADGGEVKKWSAIRITEK